MAVPGSLDADLALVAESDRRFAEEVLPRLGELGGWRPRLTTGAGRRRLILRRRQGADDLAPPRALRIAGGEA
jgi:hypothetical protein